MNCHHPARCDDEWTIVILARNSSYQSVKLHDQGRNNDDGHIDNDIDDDDDYNDYDRKWPSESNCIG